MRHREGEDSLSLSTHPLTPVAELAAEARRLLRELAASDRIALGGAALLLASCLLPWQETAGQGALAGLLGLGLPGCMAALAVGGAVVVRVRRLLPRAEPRAPWLVQISASAFAVLWCSLCMRLAWDTYRVPSSLGEVTVRSSSPAFGIYVGLAGALVTVAGTLLNLKEKQA